MDRLQLTIHIFLPELLIYNLLPLDIFETQ